MALDILGTKIKAVYVLDDKPDVRDTMAYPVEELHLRAQKVDGPIPDVDRFIREAVRSGDAAICDHHLRVANYAAVNGSEFVKRFYERHFPAVLCTKWQNADIHEMRRFRRFVPVLLAPDELTPTSIRDGFMRCLEEFAGNFREDRRPWRVLVRIEDVIEEDFYFVVPAWDSTSGFRLPLEDLPKPFREPGKLPLRLHAFVNLGAVREEDLYFERWEK